MRKKNLIHLAAKTDLAHLHAIERAAAALFPAGRIPDVDDVMPLVDLQKAADDGLLFVATSGNARAGFAMAQSRVDCLHLAVMAVHPDYGNRGLGRELVLAMLQEAARRQLAHVTLTTFADLPWNGPFYRKTGFRMLSETELAPFLRDILAQEARLGMVNRIAMQCEIAAAT